MKEAIAAKLAHVHDLGISAGDELTIVRQQRNDLLNQLTHQQIINHKLRDLVDKLSAQLSEHTTQIEEAEEAA